MQYQICIASKKNGYFIAGDASVHKCEMAMNDDYYYDKSLIGFIDKNGNLVIDKEKEIKWLTRSRDLDSCYDCIAFIYYFLDIKSTVYSINSSILLKLSVDSLCKSNEIL